VNGAQSLTALFHNKSVITTDLRLLLRVIQISGNDDLSRQITLISNNQNAIKPRDLRSNNQIQTRLKREFEQLDFEGYVLEVKRGESSAGKNVLSNEEAGRLLLAFDLSEPWACHQIYRVFDELYTRIFGRPEVNAPRIVFLHLVMEAIRDSLSKINNQPFANYTLTRFFMLDVVAQLMRKDKVASRFSRDPSELLGNGVTRQKFFSALTNILGGLVVDLNYEVETKGDAFNYKTLLKSQKDCRDLAEQLLRTFDRDVARGKAETFTGLWKKA
jgi:hypothetical protein